MQKGYEDPQNYDRANFFVCCWGLALSSDSKVVYDGARKKLDIFMGPWLSRSSRKSSFAYKFLWLYVLMIKPIIGPSFPHRNYKNILEFLMPQPLHIRSEAHVERWGHVHASCSRGVCSAHSRFRVDFGFVQL